MGAQILLPHAFGTYSVRIHGKNTITLYPSDVEHGNMLNYLYRARRKT